MQAVVGCKEFWCTTAMTMAPHKQARLHSSYMLLAEQDEVLDSLSSLTAGVVSSVGADQSARERVAQESAFNTLEAKVGELIANGGGCGGGGVHACPCAVTLSFQSCAWARGQKFRLRHQLLRSLGVCGWPTVDLAWVLTVHACAGQGPDHHRFCYSATRC